MRAACSVKELLGSYKGPILTDGYASYKTHFKGEKGIDLAFFWSHARKKFIDIEQNYPEECGKVLKLMGEIFKVESKAKTYEELKSLRQTESKDLVLKLQDLYYELYGKARPESGLKKAIDYSFNHWDGLNLFLENEKIPMTNNEAERTIRHSVMGRKNFHGSRTQRGVETAAVLYTIVESCKKVELDPKHYIVLPFRFSVS